MTPLRSLSFSLHKRTLPAAAEGHPGLELVTPLLLIDGISLFGDQVPHVDTLELLVSGPHQGDLTLCTCSCGVAECAGFWEPVQVQVTKELVTWHIPAVGYHRVVAAGEFGEGPWTFVFPRDAYFDSLRQLERQCVLEQKAAPGLVFSPGSDPEEEGMPRPPASLASILALCRPAKALEVASRQTMERAAGSLLRQALHVTLAGRTWKLHPQSLLTAYAVSTGLPARAGAPAELPAFKQVWRHAAEKLQAAPLSFLLALPEDGFPVGFPVKGAQANELLDRERLQAAGADIQLEWVSSDA